MRKIPIKWSRPLIALTAMAMGTGALAGATTTPAADPATGRWITDSGKGKVLVAQCRADKTKLCGTIYWLAEQTSAHILADDKNANAALRARPLVGVDVLSNLTYVAPGRWDSGKVYDPEAGKTYDASITAGPDGTLSVKGCLMFLCQSRVWSRVAK